MHKLRPRFAIGFLVAVPALTGACASPREALSPELLGRHANVKTLAFAHELVPTCQLESLPGETPPSAAAPWAKVAPNELAGAQVAVLDKQTWGREGPPRFRALRVKEANGRTRWLRNTPASSPAEVEQRWACATDAERVSSSAKPITAEVVRLVPGAPSCGGLTPIFGETADVSFEPYTIAGRRLFLTQKGLAVAVTLVSAEGDSALTVLGSDLDSCFAVTRRAPTPRDERTAVIAWLGDPSAAPPNVELKSYRQTVGLDDNACLSEGEGSTKHDECRGAAFGTAKDLNGPLGKRFVFFRERVTSAVHAYGGKLAPAEELAGVNVVVRQVQSREDGAFAPAFSKALVASLLDATKQRARSDAGYRVIRPQDTVAGTTANANLDIEVAFSMPKLETQQQDRRQRRARGKVQGPNPEHARAVRRIESARSALRAAEVEAAAYDKLFAAPLPKCAPGAPASCDVAAKRGLGTTRAQKMRERVAALEAAAKTIPETLAQDDIVAVDYRAKVFRRLGEATVTFKLTPTEALPGIPPLQLTRRVPFEASEVEVTAAPGVEAKAAKPPEREQVDLAVAHAILGETDALLGTWMRRATPAASGAAFEPGSRAQLALLARYTASNRRVKLLSDVIEDRPERLASRAEYPINVPTGADRCYTFVATPLRQGGDANLVLRAAASSALVARDGRSAPDAGFDVCPLQPGKYVLELTSSAGVPAAFAMFESTPGVDADPDYGATMPASLGNPSGRTPPAATTPPSPAPKR